MKLHHGVIAGLTLGAIALVTASCTVVVGYGDYRVGCQPTPAGPSPCAKCGATSCAPQVRDCGTDCAAYEECGNNCTTDTCSNDCAAKHPTGRQQFEALFACLEQSCVVCVRGGVGDRCGSDSDCFTGLTCNNGGFCTKSCSCDSECAGRFNDGLNLFGRGNVCALTKGNTGSCFPGCASDSECASAYNLTQAGACVAGTGPLGGTKQGCSP
jgi:hypothetical protein